MIHVLAHKVPADPIDPIDLYHFNLRLMKPTNYIKQQTYVFTSFVTS